MIRGRKHEIANVTKFEKELSAHIHNRFDIEVMDAATGKVKQKAVGYNTICNNLWSYLFEKKKGYFEYIQYGSGNGTPSTADVALFKYEGQVSLGGWNGQYGKIGSQMSCDYERGILKRTVKVSISETTSVGIEITEIGIAAGDASSSSGRESLCTHAMLQDMNGNPISILKTDKDIINFYATIYLHFDPCGYDNGFVVPFLIAPEGEYSKSIFTLGAVILGWQSLETVRTYVTARDRYTLEVGQDQDSNGLGGVTTAIDPQNKTITYSFRIPVGSANISKRGIHRIIMFCRYYSGANETNTPLALLDVGGNWFKKSVVTNEVLGTGDGETKDFSPAFPLIHNVKVYVDGEEVPSSAEYSPMTNNSSSVLVPLRRSSKSNMVQRMLLSAAYTYGGSWKYVYTCDGVFYNPFYESNGITKIHAGYWGSESQLYVSNNLDEWTLVNNASISSGYIIIPEDYRNYPYYKICNSVDNTKPYRTEVSNFATFASKFNTNTIHLESAPPLDSIITVDYETDCIAKDINHVFDFALKIQLGEHSEAQ